MKALKVVLALLLAVCAVVLAVNALQAQHTLPELLPRLDPQNLADSDSRMATARDRVLTALEGTEREKTLRALERYTDSYKEQLDLSGQNGLDLFFYRHSPSLLAVSILLLVIALAIAASLIDGLRRYKRGFVYLVLITLLYAGVYIVENTVGSSTMLMTVLKKGAIYALIAVSMNLLNGFTGLFSL